jgi:Fe-S-cluster containining protein
MDAATALCTQCGICCSDLLFGYIELETKEEAEWAKRRSLPLVEKHGGLAITLACRVLDGRRCGDYENRPAVCRAFRCKLLRALDVGEIGLDEALARVERVRELARRVFPEGRRPVPTTDVAGLLDAAQLEALLRRDFREPT